MIGKIFNFVGFALCLTLLGLTTMARLTKAGVGESSAVFCEGYDLLTRQPVSHWAINPFAGHKFLTLSGSYQPQPEAKGQQFVVDAGVNPQFIKDMCLYSFRYFHPDHAGTYYEVSALTTRKHMLASSSPLVFSPSAPYPTGLDSGWAYGLTPAPHASSNAAFYKVVAMRIVAASVVGATLCLVHQQIGSLLQAFAPVLGNLSKLATVALATYTIVTADNASAAAKQLGQLEKAVEQASKAQGAKKKAQEAAAAEKELDTFLRVRGAVLENDKKYLDSHHEVVCKDYRKAKCSGRLFGAADHDRRFICERIADFCGFDDNLLPAAASGGELKGRPSEA